MADGARVEEAETFYVTALQIREQVLGPGHPAYAATLNNLAALYKVRTCVCVCACVCVCVYWRHSIQSA